MLSRRNDYASAKQYLLDLTAKYATNIVPEEVSMRVKICDVREGASCNLPTLAYATGNADGTRAMLVYDSKLIKTNMYNMKSKFFDALAIHELCHIRHGFEEPGVKSKFHLKPLYIDCIKKWYPDDWAYKSETHPDRYSFRAYLGSDDKLVPRCINHMMFYICKDCRSSNLWNTHYIGHRPFHCEICNSENISWTKLDPFDVYRIAMINEIDFVEYTTPAMYNEA